LRCASKRHFALFFRETGALDDLLPDWGFAHHARMQLSGPFIFHHEAGFQHFFLDVGLGRDDARFLGEAARDAASLKRE